MPAAFDRCVEGGGRVRTVSGPNKDMGLKENQFVHICFPKGGGGSVRGEVKTKKKAEAVEKGGES